MEECEVILKKRGVKPTANRILVLRTMLSAVCPLSLQEIEAVMETMDKSSIFRVLNLFAKNHVVHVIEDGAGTVKFEVCRGEDSCSLDDMHTHFYCEVCCRTFCFKTIHIPEIDLPDGFVMNSINYVVKGICPECARKSCCVAR